MAVAPVSALLKLPASERAALAMALWDSLTDAERDAELVLTLSRKWSWIGAGRRISKTPPRRFPGLKCAAR